MDDSVSTWVSRSLYLIGKCASSSNVCKNQALLNDFIMTQRTGLRQITSGSGAEGTFTRASDIDRMQVYLDICVATRQDPASHFDGKRNIFSLDTSDSNPGYARLRVPPGVSYQHPTFGEFKDIIETTSDGMYLSSEKFVRYQLDHHELPSESVATPIRHGPCINFEYESLYGFHNIPPGNILENDMAFSLLCDDWPPGALEWFSRERLHDWPRQDVREKLRKEEFHVVPVGDPTSKHAPLEWRLSYLLGERELIWNFNDTQIQCYIVLKLLTKRNIAPTIPEGVTSYHLKTVVFWQSEGTGLSAWKEDRLLHCVSQCLSYLADCVRCGRLPHYFCRGNNLLRHKLKSQSDRDFILKTVESIQAKLVPEVLACLPSCYVQKYWYACRDICTLVSICSNVEVLNKYYGVCRNVSDTHKRFKGVFNMLCNQTDYLDNEEFLQRATVAIKESNQVADAFYTEKTQCCCDIRAGIQLFKSSTNPALSEEEKRKRINQAITTMETGSRINDLVGCLYLATLHYSLRNYDLCEEIVLNAIQKHRYLLYAGRCSTLLGLEVELPQMKIKQTKDAPVTGEEDEVLQTTFDVVFSKEDAEFVPYPVKFECGIFPAEGERIFILHPFTYAFSLLFVTQFFKKRPHKAREYLASLADVIQQSGESNFRSRALNILGFCYSLDGQIKEAIMCYSRSVQITKNTPVGNRNAALYHLASLCLGAYTRINS